MIKKSIFLIFIFTCLVSFAQINQTEAVALSAPKKSTINFIENKGQITDQFYRPRTDVLYLVSTENLNLFVKNNGVSYQLQRVDEWQEKFNQKTRTNYKQIERQTFYRIDLSWVNANSDFKKIEDEVLTGYSNYYLTGCPNGAFDVRSFKGFTFKNLFNGIDLHYYEKNGDVKYDYIVAPYSDYRQIQIKIQGAEVIINNDGTLFLNTPLGKVQEGKPLVYQNGRLLNAKWILTDNTLSFSIENYNPSMELVIDPITRVWGTYFGGENLEYGSSICRDSNGNVYLSGCTYSASNIATVGAFQQTLGGVDTDAFLTKFNSAGTRLWSTYYGGNNFEQYIDACTDPAGNIYMTGMTGSDSGNVMATPGSHQFTCGGLADAFLVKFDPSGFRQWGTYYGGAGGDGGVSVCTDAFGSVYISGYTDSAGTQLPSYTGIATSGCHQSSFGGMADAFVVKFDGNGNRQWGTYYGGNGEEFGRNVSTDGSGNVFLTGETTSTNAIATAGSHQSSNLFLYNMEAFLVKFNTNGVRQWGTYYGIAAIGYSTCADFNGNVYLSGCSYLADSISTPGAFQTNFGGSSGSSTDAFLVKFNSNGVRQWGTLYGGNGDDYAFSCTYDPNNNVLITGSTGSNNIIATNNSFQNVLGGLYDAFAAKFDTNGNRIWGTFYGGNGGDEANDICIDPAGNIYLSGVSYSTNGNSIATTGCYQESFGGGLRDLFLVKLKECVEIDSISMIKPTCGNDNGSISITLNLGIGPYNIQWSNGDFGLTADSLAPGQYVVQITDANGCYLSKSINLNPSNGPSVTATSQNNVTCNGGSNGSVALTISGGANPIGILWSNGATTSSISNLPAGVYDAVITDASGCIVNASYNVTEPNPIAVSFSTTPASCGINDGSLSVTVTGGTSPYTYQWSANAASQTTPTASNLGNGIYSLNITDNANCAFAASGIVNTSSSGPSLSFSVTPSGGCGGSAQGSIDLTPNGGATPYNFQWSNGASSEDISGLSPGTYSVIVTGGDGCSSSDTVFVSNASGNINPELCIVSVDPISSTNKVIWEKPGSANGIKEYKIYREGSALNVYNLIKILPFDSVSEYTDPVANPAVRAWRYKISFKDSCGVETVLSPNHKTIHLAVNVGINNTRNLAWDAYEGFSFPTFNIWRYHASTGWVKLDSLPSNLYSYTDLNPPGGGTLDYAIEVERTAPCNSTRTLITTSRSNVKNIVAPLTTGINDSQVESFGIYPNPAKNNFTIDVSVKTKSELIVRLLDVRGRELRKEKRMLKTGKNQELISVEELASGIYLLELELNNQVLRAKLLKEE